MQTLAIILTLIGLFAAGVAWGVSDPDLRGWGAVLGAAFLVSAAGAWPAWLLTQSRQDAARIRSTVAPTNTWGDDNPPAPDPEHALRHSSGWQQSVAVAVPATLALLLMAWIRPAGGGANQELVPAIIALVLLFPLVVVERLVADLATAILPERDGLVRILRIPVATCGLAGLSLLAASMGWQLAWYAQWPAAVLVAVVAVELLGRAVINLWLPAPEPRSCADSVVAGAILARINPVTAVVEGLRDRFGVDLSRSWSAQVVAAAFPWVAIAMLIVGWLLSGVSVVALGKRVVLEGHGEARVLGAGTHLHAPWPFAVRRTIEDGRIRETILGDLDKPLTPIDAQAIPPAAYDRLWDVAHPAEATFLVPASSTTGTGQGFRIVSSDVRVHWRIGSSDADAIAAVGRLNDADALVGQAARRALTATFSTRPLEGLIALPVARAVCWWQPSSLTPSTHRPEQQQHTTGCSRLKSKRGPWSPARGRKLCALPPWLPSKPRTVVPQRLLQQSRPRPRRPPMRPASPRIRPRGRPIARPWPPSDGWQPSAPVSARNR